MAETAHWAGRRVLLTGISGFIGLNLAHRLQSLGATVHGLVRSPLPERLPPPLRAGITQHVGDLSDETAIARAFQAAEPSVVFHLAAPRGGPSDWKRLVADNVQLAMTFVSQLTDRPGTSMVVAGSSLEYSPSAAPLREHDLIAPRTWHGVGKANATMIYLNAARSMGLKINVLRLFHVYGPWEADHRLLPTAITAAFRGTPLPMTAGTIRRDWVHVDDVVDALLMAAGHAPWGLVANIGSGQEASNEEVVTLVERLTGRSIERQPGRFPASPSDTEHRCADIGLAGRTLGWVPRHDLASGIAATIAWHLDTPDGYQSTGRGRPLHA